MNHWYIQRGGANQPGANKPEGKSARHKERISQRANKPGGERARGRISQGANEPGNEQARSEPAKGRKSHNSKNSVGYKTEANFWPIRDETRLPFTAFTTSVILYPQNPHSFAKSLYISVQKIYFSICF